jgi:prepilin-type N-terminal cleavage/methylation domain-containing protein
METYLLMKKAFTLIELLVVIAIIAILAALLLTAIAKSKSIAQRVACINNQKQLQMAHTMFSDDHGDKILYSSSWKYERCSEYTWAPGSLNLSKYINKSPII